MRVELLVSAELSNVEKFDFHDTETEPFYFTFYVECVGCHSEHPKEIAFNRFEKVSLSNSRGEANFEMACKSCGKSGSISWVDAKTKGYSDESKNKAGYALVAAFECRGVAPVRFVPRGEFDAVTSAETKVTFEFEDGEFYDFDEKAGEISITDVQWEVK